MVNVLWGSFSDRKAAQDQLAALPGSLRANRPYVRTLDVIRAENDRQKGQIAGSGDGPPARQAPDQGS